jgi:hypothetical protein
MCISLLQHLVEAVTRPGAAGEYLGTWRRIPVAIVPSLRMCPGPKSTYTCVRKGGATFRLPWKPRFISFEYFGIFVCAKNKENKTKEGE